MKNKSLLTVVFVALVAGAIGAVVTRTTVIQSAMAQTSAASPRWEYCAITWVPSAGTAGGGIRYYANVLHFREAGQQIEEIEGTSRENALNRAIAKLGADKWEMVGESPYGRLIDSDHQVTALYFKRTRN